ncbi:MAG: hypothetical protein RIQ89_995 [Bacteroidota bacterium]
MAQTLKLFYTTVGKKYIMALTGLFLVLFLTSHLYTNLLLYKIDKGEAYLEMSKFLQTNMIVRLIEIGLFASIIFHTVQGIYLAFANRRARPVRYAVSNQAKNSTWFSRNMVLTGSIIFIFIVIHMRTFFVPHRILGDHSQDMAQSVAYAFQNGIYSAFYVFAMILLGAHLNHGIQSAITTLGFNNNAWEKTIRAIGTSLAMMYMVGFGSMPIAFFFDFFGIASNILNN